MKTLLAFLVKCAGLLAVAVAAAYALLRLDRACRSVEWVDE